MNKILHFNFPRLLERFFIQKKFFGICGLQTGCEFIVWFSIVNKLCGIYGVLALFQSADVSFAEVTMYVCSFIFLFIFGWLSIYIPKRTVFHALVFSYTYLIDSLINFLFLIFFSISWFMHLVENAAIPDAGVSTLTERADAGSAVDNTTTGSTNPFLQAESAPSIIMLVLVAGFRIYFILVTISYSSELVLESETRPQQFQTNLSGRIMRLLLKPYSMAANRVYLRKPLPRDENNSIELQRRLVEEFV
ncbi:inositol phoshorylceramide synthase regulatory subunit Kei1 [Schizosaccharomyces japonicus yFS275]|uniref:Inositol phoshorylceramide synthase regulatory subunit Kei1 n=1 Tax=Schizosaccharomyces japonicus (strain yFS275 / FY16936) TaxID=402676 RepID=B6K334_SCHJY|nr:inositol phoshorylceramide synthase regulatory subunit Kei1 [Schizosaccharomyces japonicus yFS275]EEB07891.2 inositol phoshorylceramide synthase regulatory subunit Kei1 [Schizosaccharomyces japonicus yFS275]